MTHLTTLIFDVFLYSKRDDIYNYYNIISIETWLAIVINFANCCLGLNNNGSSVKWSPDVVRIFARRESGVADAVQNQPYSIGYTSVAAATLNKLPFASIVNKAGYAMLPNYDSVISAMDDFSDQMTARLTASLVDAPSNSSYPISGYTYMIIRMSGMQDCASATEMLRYIRYFSSNADTNIDANEMGMITLSNVIRKRIESTVLTKFSCGGKLVASLLQLQLEAEARSSTNSPPWRTPVIITASCFSVFFITLVLFLIYQRLKNERLLNMIDWEIKSDNINIELNRREKHIDRWQKFQQRNSLMPTLSHASNGGGKVGSIEQSSKLSLFAIWNGYEVLLCKTSLPIEQHFYSRSIKKRLIALRETINHENVVKFYGLSNLSNERFIVVEHCHKGSLVSVLHDDHYSLTDVVQISFAQDIVNGMQFLHLKGLVHGSLSSDSCMIDKRWNVKIARWSENYLPRFFIKPSNLNKKNSIIPSHQTDSTDNGNEIPYQSNDFLALTQYLWQAPEMLDNGIASKPCDVYSFGIILFEIYSRSNPYEDLLRLINIKEILHSIKTICLRPSINTDLISGKVRKIMELTWAQEALMRPTFESLSTIFRQMFSTRKGGVVDAMLEELDNYSRNMEQKLAEKQAEIDALKREVNQLSVNATDI